MAKCEQCVPDTVRQFSDKQQTPFACKECGRRPAYWWQPSNNTIHFK